MIFLDFETRSKADLKVVGQENYAVDPSTEVICGVAVWDDQEYEWGHNEDPPAEILASAAAGMPLSLIHI